MSILSRLNNVIRANLSAALDRAEDPDKLIGQTILDMRDEVKRAKRELITVLGTAKRLEGKQAELDKEAATWEERALTALRNGDESLARDALRQKARVARQAEDVRSQLQGQLTAAEEMKDVIARAERRVDELETRKTSLASEVRRAREAPSALAGSTEARPSSLGDLERMMGRIDQLEAEVDVAKTLDDPGRRDLDAKFRSLEQAQRGGAIEDELASLKRKLDPR